MATIRKDSLFTGGIYHIFNRSIAGYVIFNSPDEYNRMVELIKLCRFTNFGYKYSKFIKLELYNKIAIIKELEKDNNVLVEIIAFCIMPTHIHFVIKQTTDGGISKYLGRISNSFSKYFNLKHKRNGPLWSSRFKNIVVENDEQLLHLTRYIHLNPVSANLVKNISDWPNSSYLEYIKPDQNKSFCSYKNLFSFTPKQYREFCNDRKSYQKEISKIKSILIDNYTG